MSSFFWSVKKQNVQEFQVKIKSKIPFQSYILKLIYKHYKSELSTSITKHTERMYHVGEIWKELKL